MELLQSSRRTLSDLRQKYDSSVKTAQEEKDQAKQKAKEVRLVIVVRIISLYEATYKD